MNKNGECKYQCDKNCDESKNGTDYFNEYHSDQEDTNKVSVPSDSRERGKNEEQCHKRNDHRNPIESKAPEYIRLVPIPNLLIDEVNINFDMEVKETAAENKRAKEEKIKEEKIKD